MNIKKLTALITAAALSAAALSGCGKGEKTASGDTTIKWWTPNWAPNYLTSYNDLECFKKAGEKVGVKIDFINVTTQDAPEQFNLLAASGNLPDVIGYNLAWVGGATKAIKDGVVIDLKDYITKDKMPNLTKLLEKNETYRKLIKNYDGSVSTFPEFKENTYTNAFFGPTIRKDWLDKLGLETPETIEDWYNVLKAFKTGDPNGNGKADEIPFAADKEIFFSYLASTYGVTFDFCKNEKGEVVYGPIQPEFKEFLTEMNKWYKEGLIDPEFASLTRTNVDARITNSTSGAYVGYIGSQLGNYLSALDGTDAKLIGVQWPSKEEGGKHYGGMRELIDMAGSAGTAITTANKKIDKTIELIDYCYSKEGSDLFNWGIEGKTYSKENGEYKFLDSVINNPEKKDPVGVLAKYCLPIYSSGARVMSSDAYMQVGMGRDEQRAAADEWSSCDTSLFLPTLPFTTDEQDTISDVMGDAKTYYTDMFVKFVMGVEPISNFDKFAANIEKMGIDKVLKCYKAAYERYEKE